MPANTVLPDGSDSFPCPAADRQPQLCSTVWKTCEDTPTGLCACCGQRCGDAGNLACPMRATCGNSVHRLCGRGKLSTAGNADAGFPERLAYAGSTQRAKAGHAERMAGFRHREGPETP